MSFKARRRRGPSHGLPIGPLVAALQRLADCAFEAAILQSLAQLRRRGLPPWRSLVWLSRSGTSVSGRHKREYDQQDEQHGRAGERPEEDRDGERRPQIAPVAAQPEFLDPPIFSAGTELIGMGAGARNLPTSLPEGYRREIRAAVLGRYHSTLFIRAQMRPSATPVTATKGEWVDWYLDGA